MPKQPPHPAPIDTDVLVIGAGPTGLYQAFQLGLLGLSFEIVDALPMAGGQCAALYPDKPIYDIPGIPVISGAELTQQLLTQCQPFMSAAPIVRRANNGTAPPHLHLGCVIDQIQARPAPTAGFEITGSQGLHWHSKAVVIAGGVGAFQPRQWSIPGVETSHPLSNLHHHLPEVSTMVTPPWAGQQLLIAGGGDEALSAVVQLASAPATQAPSHITLVHRRAQFTATAELQAQVMGLLSQGKVSFRPGVPLTAAVTGDCLTAITLATPDGQQETLPIGHVLVQLGLSPRLGPIANWGLHMSRKQLEVNSSDMGTNLPGIYAVGDVCTYPGKLRLIACGFHEATLAAHACLARIYPEASGPLQYTTSSETLLKRLGRAL